MALEPLLHGGAQSDRLRPARFTAPVERVVDGDTAWMRFADESRKVRIVGIDTPERGEPGVGAATDAARARYAGRTVTQAIGGAESRRNGGCVGWAVLDRYGRVPARVDEWPAIVAPWDKGPWRRSACAGSQLRGDPMLTQTFADLLDHGLQPAFHCWRCSRWTEADLARIVASGRRDEVYVGKKPRCGGCGAVGAMQARPRRSMIGAG